MVGEANVREVGKNFSLAGEGEIEDDSLQMICLQMNRVVWSV
jgi:hypothetical protein